MTSVANVVLMETSIPNQEEPSTQIRQFVGQFSNPDKKRGLFYWRAKLSWQKQDDTFRFAIAKRGR